MHCYSTNSSVGMSPASDSPTTNSDQIMGTQESLQHYLASLKISIEEQHPVVSLELFFAGNSDKCSIGEERPRKHDPQFYFNAFRELRAHENVLDVLVEVNGPGEEGHWPTADTIWVVTSLPLFPELQSILPPAFAEILPDDRLTYPRTDGKSTDAITIPAGFEAWGFYYY